MKYILQLICGGPGEPRWMCDIHAERGDIEAKTRALDLLQNSKGAQIAHAATLWQEDRPVASWDLTHTPMVRLRRTK